MAETPQTTSTDSVADTLNKDNDIFKVIVHVARIATESLYGANALYHPVQATAEALIQKAGDAGYDVAIASTFRNAEYQNELYAQGRTKPGAIVTNAEAYQSYHQYGLAFDISLSRKDKQAVTQADYATVGHIGEGLDLIWGGTFGDDGHFEYHPTYNWEDLKAVFDAPVNPR